MRTWLNQHRPLSFIHWRPKSIDGGPVMPSGVPRRGSDVSVYSLTIRLFDVVLPPVALQVCRRRAAPAAGLSCSV